VTSLVNGPRGRGPRPPGRRGEASLADVVDVDPRIEARRAEVRLSRLTRRRHQWLVGSVIVTVLVLVYGLTRTSLLDVDDVIVTGAAHTPADEVRTASAIRPGDPLTDVDADRAIGAVRALAWIDDATVVRRWSGSVEVSVTEREPAVAVEGDVGVALVDRRSRVLAVEPAAPAALLLVRGVPIVAPGETMPPVMEGALAVAAALPAGLRTRVTAIDVVGDEVELALRPSGRARIGTVDKLDLKMRALLVLFGQVDLQKLCVMDVSVPANPVLTRQDPCG
jgi:cell division protein FtsQ